MIRASDIAEHAAKQRVLSDEQAVREYWPHVVALAERWATNPLPSMESLEDDAYYREMYARTHEYISAAISDAHPISNGCERALAADSEGPDSASPGTRESRMISSGWTVWGDVPTPQEEEWVNQYALRCRSFVLVTRSATATRTVKENGEVHTEVTASSYWRYGNEYPTIAHAICCSVACGRKIERDMLQQGGFPEEVEASTIQMLTSNTLLSMAASMC